MAARRCILRIGLRIASPATRHAARDCPPAPLSDASPAPAALAQDFFFLRSYAKFSRRNNEDEDDDDAVDPKSKPDPQKGPRMNRAITDPYVRLVTAEGHRVVRRQEALEIAKKQNLDLVEVDPTNEPVVCKIMDYKLERYREKMREKERKKTNVDSRRLNEIKELQVTTKIDDRDLEMKAENASRLIQKGHRLKCVVKVLVKGSKADEAAKADKQYRTDPRGSQLVNKIIDLLKDVAKVESGPQVERHQVWAMLRPIPETKQSSKSSEKKKTGESSSSSKTAAEGDGKQQQIEEQK